MKNKRQDKDPRLGAQHSYTTSICRIKNTLVRIIYIYISSSNSFFNIFINSVNLKYHVFKFYERNGHFFG